MKPLVAAVLLASVALVLAGPAAASCREPPPLPQAIAEADAVFIGTVHALGNDDRRAQVEVAEIWKGPDLPRVVQVNGGEGEPGTFTSVDRIYAQGATYLFVVRILDGELQDNACSQTTPWEEELVVQRPSEARPPADGGTAAGLSIPMPFLGLAVGIVIIVILSGVAFARTRPG